MSAHVLARRARTLYEGAHARPAPDHFTFAGGANPGLVVPWQSGFSQRGWARASRSPNAVYTRYLGTCPVNGTSDAVPLRAPVQLVDWVADNARACVHPSFPAPSAGGSWLGAQTLGGAGAVARAARRRAGERPVVKRTEPESGAELALRRALGHLQAPSERLARHVEADRARGDCRPGVACAARGLTVKPLRVAMDGASYLQLRKAACR